MPPGGAEELSFVHWESGGRTCSHSFAQHGAPRRDGWSPPSPPVKCVGPVSPPIRKSPHRQK
ncbi:hypothetical protein T492DRAFT_959818 [Pavlovales sp. CCMP2436]|nr:hypothetical protein T492DRAFT_959818 [Pavlovales sp. CCMP2436]